MKAWHTPRLPPAAASCSAASLVAALLLVAAAAGSAATGAAGHGEGGGQIVFHSNRADGNVDIYVMNADASGVKRLTFGAASDRQPAWSPDARRIAFVSDRDGDNEIFVMNWDGSGARQLTANDLNDTVPTWTEDGRIVFQRGPAACPCAIWTIRENGTGERLVETGPGNAMLPDASPRSDQIAFAGDARGVWEIYTVPHDGRKHAPRRITDATGMVFGDFRPRWSPDGEQLVFMRDVANTQNDMWVVRRDGSGARLVLRTPNRFEEQASWSPDGRRILFGVFPSPGLDPSEGLPRLNTIRIDGTDERQVPLQAGAISDTFGDGVRDSSVWHEIADPGATVAEINGHLEMAIDGGAVPGGPYNQVDAHWGLQCVTPADFDAQVDVRLLTWPTPGGFYAGLNAIFADAGIWRHSAPWGDDLSAWISPSATGVPTTESTLSLRVVRSGIVTKVLERHALRPWTTVLTGTSSAGGAVLAPQLSTPATEFQGKSGRVTFDNFRLTATTLSCPAWWDAAYGDWSAG